MNRKKIKSKMAAIHASKSANNAVVFYLYIAGRTPHCLLALANIERFCKTHLPDRHSIKVIDIAKYPEIAEKMNIIAIPTIIKMKPAPTQYIIGDFSNPGLMRMRLGL